jgi:hypothetical protein
MVAVGTEVASSRGMSSATHSPLSADRALVTLLSRLGAAPDLGPRSLAGALASPDLDALAARALFSPTSYVRVRLWSSRAMEVRLLCWRPGQSSSLHPGPCVG